jgi:hypothetical protein
VLAGLDLKINRLFQVRIWVATGGIGQRQGLVPQKNGFAISNMAPAKFRRASSCVFTE